MKMNVKLLIPLSMALISCLAQRPPYAGRRPIGYPEIEAAPTSGTNDLLANKFGTDGNDTECSNLPIEALGDCELVKKLLKFPVDKQPFWLLNWKALDAHRKSPQTYPSKPNPFIDTSSNQGANRLGQNPQQTDTQNRFSNQHAENNQNSSNDQINGNDMNQNIFSGQSPQKHQNFETSGINQGNQNGQKIQNQNRFSNQPTQGNQNFPSSGFNQGIGNFGNQNTQQIQNQNRFSNLPTATNTQSSLGNQNGQRVESLAFANNNQASSFAGVFTNKNNNVIPNNNGQVNGNRHHEGDLNDFITSSAPSTNKPRNSDTSKLFAEELNKKPFTS